MLMLLKLKGDIVRRAWSIILTKIQVSIVANNVLGDEEASAKFADIARAYEVLSEPTKKQYYD